MGINRRSSRNQCLHCGNFFCCPVSFFHTRTQQNNPAMCSFPSTVGTNAAPYSAKDDGRLEGIIATAHSSSLAVTIVRCCSLCYVASKRYRQHGCELTVLTVHTGCTSRLFKFSKITVCNRWSIEERLYFACAPVLFSHSISVMSNATTLHDLNRTAPWPDR